jgi:hypothetical protein
MIAELVTSALLDSQTGEFMRSFMKEQPLKYEYLPGRGVNMFTVIRYAFDGSRTYLGEIQRVYKYPETWEVVSVAARRFYGKASGKETHRRQEQRFRPGEGKDYRTKEAASDKLWELYNIKT